MIAFHSIGFPNPIKKIKDVRNYLLFILQEHGKIDGDINIILVNDDYLLKINEEFLNHTDYTDTISFSYNENDSNVIEGDIYISYERIKENSYLYHCSIYEELMRVIIHGILHLLGYEDKTSNTNMIEKQEKYLEQFLNS